MRLPIRTENEKKFRELVLYISQRCADHPTFGSVKLNKILFYADFLAFANLGKAITNFEYQKLPNGPAPRRLVPVRKKMIEEGILGLQEVCLKSGAIQKRPVNLRSPNLSLFSGQEISLVDELIDVFKDSRAEEVSEISHRMVGWIVAEEGETIPYTTIFLENPPLSDEEMQRSRELATKYGVAAAAR